MSREDNRTTANVDSLSAEDSLTANVLFQTLRASRGVRVNFPNSHPALGLAGGDGLVAVGLSHASSICQPVVTGAIVGRVESGLSKLLAGRGGAEGDVALVQLADNSRSISGSG